MFLPKARDKDIIVQNNGKELLIYDLNINKALSLNETSRIIYQSCDGLTSFDDLKNKHRDFTDDVILLGLSALSSKNLLEEKFETGFSRRQLLMSVASSTIALPLIIGIIAPTSANAQSACVIGGDPCNLNNPGACCSLTCLANDGNPICSNVCVQDGNPCNLNDPGACCSLVCLANDGNPICASACVSSGNPCNLNNPGACCSKTCLNNDGNTVCL